MIRRPLLLCTLTSLALAACSSSGTSDPGGNPSNETALAKSNLQRAPAAEVPSDALSGASAANNAFAVDLYAQVLTAPTASTHNVLTSPLSASLALTMAFSGAHGQTATEMAAALHARPNARDAAFAGQNALSQGLNARAAAAFARATQNAKSGGAAPSADDYQLQVVNSVWGEKSYTWEAPFLDILATNYGTGVYQTDFIHAYEPARLSINAWVSDHTNDKINDLLAKGVLDDATRMVLVNALHLKMPWETPFEASLTRPDTFTLADASTVSADFMRLTTNLGYADDGDAQVVTLPLANRELSVVIALPHDGVSLSSYEAKLGAKSGVLAPPPQTQLVALSLPKVNFTSPSFSLAEPLKALGMNQAFDRAQADFHGLCAQPPDGANLYVSDVVQKAMIAMEESGVEAAAATAVVVAGTTSIEVDPPSPVSVVVNRPFMISIVDQPTGAVLMLGHVQNPTETAQ